jgi:hypothetical protein
MEQSKFASFRSEYGPFSIEGRPTYGFAQKIGAASVSVAFSDVGTAAATGVSSVQATARNIGILGLKSV